MQLGEIKKIIYTCDSPVYLQRAEAFGDLLDSKGWKDINVFVGSITDPYWLQINRNWKGLWKELETPFLWLEDDCAIHNWRDAVDIPADADIAYLGGTTYRIQPINYNKEWLRVNRMESAHALIWLNNDAKNKFISQLGEEKPCDVYLSEFDCNKYVLKNPIFYQRDGHNDEPTRTYWRRGCNCGHRQSLRDIRNYRIQKR